MSQGPYVDADLPRQWLEHLIDRHGSQVVVEELTGVPSRTQYRLLRGSKRVALHTADRLAIFADAQGDLMDMDLRETTRHPLGRWALRHDCCDACATTERPHHCKGLCLLCHGRSITGAKVTGPAVNRRHFTPAQVDDIRARLPRETRAAIARSLGVSKNVINHIATGRSYAR